MLHLGDLILADSMAQLQAKARMAQEAKERRDRFAMAIAAGLVVTDEAAEWDFQQFAKRVVMQADALISELDKQ